MKGFVIVLFAMLFISCNVDPEPLRYGKDGCHHCRMTLVDKKFGAEVVTAKGKIYKFDDVNCMVNFIHSGILEGETRVHTLIVDYAQPEKLIPAEKAFYLKADKIRSPMASQVAAFETEASRQEYQSKLNATYLGWDEVVAQFK